MKLPRVTALCLALMSGALHAEKVENVKLDLVWDMNPTAGIYTNKNTGVSFTQNIAGFKGHNAYPLAKDGISDFEYWGQNGILNIHLAHRAAVNLPKQANYSTPFFKNYRPLLLKNAGKIGAETSSGLVYQANGKRGKGHKISLYLVSSPKFDGKSVYDEFGVVQIGEFLLYYRGTFLSKDGVADLARFLRAIGITPA